MGVYIQADHHFSTRNSEKMNSWVKDWRGGGVRRMMKDQAGLETEFPGREKDGRTVLVVALTWCRLGIPVDRGKRASESGSESESAISSASTVVAFYAAVS